MVMNGRQLEHVHLQDKPSPPDICPKEDSYVKRGKARPASSRDKKLELSRNGPFLPLLATAI
jgi:hypothetical protein